MTRIAWLRCRVGARCTRRLSGRARQDTIDRPINIYVAGTAGGGIDLYARRARPPHRPPHPRQAHGQRAGDARRGRHPRRQFPGPAGAQGRHRDHDLRRRADPRAADRRRANTTTTWSQFTWIGAVTKDVGLCVAWGASPFKTIEDAQREQMIVAGTGAGSDTDTWPVILNELIGTKFKVVTGYQGTQETIIAIERGEAHGRCTFSLSAIKTAKPDWLRDKKINVLDPACLREAHRLPERAADLRPGVEAGRPPAARPDDRAERDGAAVRRTAGAARPRSRPCCAAPSTRP